MIQPLHDYVLVERIEDDKPKGLIYIPDVAKEKSILGRVIAVGPGKWVEGINGGVVRKKLECKVGEMWYFNSKWSEFATSHYSDDQFMYHGKLHLVMEGDLLLRKNNGPHSS